MRYPQRRMRSLLPDGLQNRVFQSRLLLVFFSEPTPTLDVFVRSQINTDAAIEATSL